MAVAEEVAPLAPGRAAFEVAARAGPPAATKPARARSDRDIAAFEGFRHQLWRTALFNATAVLTGGLLLLVCRWWLRLRVALTLERCWLGEAEVVLVTLADGRQELADVTVLPRFSSVGIGVGDAGGGIHLLHEDEVLLESPGGGAKSSGAAVGVGTDRLLQFRCGRYLFNAQEQTFLPVPGMPADFLTQLVALTAAPRPALSDEWERAGRAALYGTNELAIPTPSIGTLLLEEMLHPFFLFQYLSVTIWCIQRYFSYSAIIVGMTLSSILSNVVGAYRYRRRLAAMAAFSCEVQVVGPGGRLTPLPSTSLLPGDVVVVHPGLLPCDAVLVRGEAIVDEALLTGESVPVRKVAWIPGTAALSYDPDTAKGCTLYGGTTVAQVRPGGPEGAALAVVCRTGFATAKGQLFKSILFPRQHRQTFVSDALVFIAAMLTVGMAFYVWDVVALARHGAHAGFIVLKYFDLLTIAVPPALPACLSVATAIAVSRLRRADIFVSSPSAINVAGLLDVIAFDKTGTLTEEGLQLQGVTPSLGADGGFGQLAQPGALPPALAEVLATCHGLARLDAGGLGGELVGDPLDQRLWEATGWHMLEDGPGQASSTAVEVVAVALSEDSEVHVAPSAASPRLPGSPGVLTTAHVATRVAPPSPGAGAYTVARRFEFSAEKQRNTVVVRRPDGTWFVATKGSPEAIRKLAAPASLPADFEEELGRYTREGLRVIALASRPLLGIAAVEVEGLSQEAAETGLAFLGFAVMVNPLRPDTTEVLGELQAAGIRCVVCTGDHARTAVSVAHQCGLLCANRPCAVVDTASDEGSVEAVALTVATAPPYGPLGPPGEPGTLLAEVAADRLDAAVTGRGFEKLRQVGGLDTALLHAGVFARMQPADKRTLVDLLGQGSLREDGSEEPGLGHHVAFCGDGANDTMALKAASVGVSLCEAEASVAAPLTSKRQTIACMLTVVAEGRCSLATSYTVFQFIISYAFIQVFGVCLMYSAGGSVGNWQYVVQDLMYITVLAGLMGLTLPATKLSAQRPPERLLSLGIWLPVASQLLLCAVFQVLALAMASHQAWYVPFQPQPDCFTVAGANSEHCSRSTDNSVIFLMSLAQFLITALVFNKGAPFRRPLYTNTWLLTAMTFQTFFLVFLVLAPASDLTQTVGGLVPLPPAFRGRLLFLMLLNLGAGYLVDMLARWCYSWMHGRRFCGVTIL